MMKKVVIVDYGVGNLLSVLRACEAVGAHAVISSDAHVIAKADRLILPGVGAFGHCMSQILERGLDKPIRDFIALKRPFLGICVGMQILNQMGYEFGEHAGLSVMDGTVEKIPEYTQSGQKQPVPYVGWARLTVRSDVGLSPSLKRLLDGQWYYLVHSYHVRASQPLCEVAHYDYGGHPITACTVFEHVVGVQFHPEKSAAAGLSFIKHFVEL